MAGIKAHHSSMRARFGGAFNEGAVMTFQNLARSSQIVASDIDYNFLPEKKGFVGSFKEAFNGEKIKGELYPRISKQLDRIVTALDMGSVDLSSGGFRSRMVDAAVENAGEMIAFEMPIVVDMSYVPCHTDFEKKPLSLRESYKRLLGVEIPAAVKTTIYFIAPKDKLRAIMQMADALALQNTRNEGAFKSAQSLGFHEQLAYQALSTEAKASLEHAPQAVAWFELKEHFIMTFDADIYQKFASAFKATGLDDKKLRQTYDDQMEARRKTGVLGWPNK